MRAALRGTRLAAPQETTTCPEATTASPCLPLAKHNLGRLCHLRRAGSAPSAGRRYAFAHCENLETAMCGFPPAPPTLRGSAARQPRPTGGGEPPPAAVRQSCSRSVRVRGLLPVSA
jgi:hypothetical protein